MSAPITGSNGLTKGSGGNLTLTNVGNNFGTLTIDGMTLTVTQAGTDYTASAIAVNVGPSATQAYLSMNPSSTAVDSAGNRPFEVATDTLDDATGHHDPQ